MAVVLGGGGNIEGQNVLDEAAEEVPGGEGQLLATGAKGTSREARGSLRP